MLVCVICNQLCTILLLSQLRAHYYIYTIIITGLKTRAVYTKVTAHWSATTFLQRKLCELIFTGGLTSIDIFFRLSLLFFFWTSCSMEVASKRQAIKRRLWGVRGQKLGGHDKQLVEEESQATFIESTGVVLFRSAPKCASTACRTPLG